MICTVVGLCCEHDVTAKAAEPVTILAKTGAQLVRAVSATPFAAQVCADFFLPPLLLVCAWCHGGHASSLLQ